MSRIIIPQIKQGEVTFPDLPAIDWTKCGGHAPEAVSFTYKGSTAKLPAADIVVITWTDDEWSAFDHVFLNSSIPRPHYSKTFQDNWHSYSKDVVPDTRSWGLYQLVNINGKKILLFKSDCHLAHPPYVTGLSAMVKAIASDTGAKTIYSIGTAGGSLLSENLGDVVITNAAHIIMQKPENTKAPDIDFNNKTFTSPSKITLGALSTKVEGSLFYALSNLVNDNFLNQLLTKLHNNPKLPTAKNYQFTDLVNAPLKAANLGSPKNILSNAKPLLTTDYYYISPNGSASPYCTLEMDDAVIAEQALNLHVNFGFVRNISDPFVASKTVVGAAIPDEIREGWSDLIYEACGQYTSFNGALAMWSILAA